MNRLNSLGPYELHQHISAWLAKHSRFARLVPLLSAIKITLHEHELVLSFCHSYFAEFYFCTVQADMETALRKCLGNIIIKYSNASVAKDLPQNSAPLFSGFACSTKNEPVLAAIRHICEASGQPCAILLLRGGSGTGKSHLLAEIARTLTTQYGETPILAAPFFPTPVSPEMFWRRRRALLLDDLQDIAGDGARQKSIAACLDFAMAKPEFYRIAIALNCDASKFGPKLCQRLEQALLLELHPADLAARIQYLEMENSRLGLGLPKSRLVLLARQIPKIPAIAGVLQKYKFYSKIGGQNLSPETLASIPLPEPAENGWRRILMLVAEKLGLKTGEILSRSRRQEFVMARHTAMFLCRTKLGLSYPELGRVFGGLDHSTVMHGIKKIQYLRTIDKDVHKLLTELESDLD